MLFAGSLVFTPPKRPVDLRDWSQWWTFMKGASWRRPYGLESVAYSDALAYAKSLTPCATGSFVKDTNDEKDRNFPVPSLLVGLGLLTVLRLARQKRLTSQRSASFSIDQMIDRLEQSTNK